MDRDQRQSDSHASELRRTTLLRHAENTDQKQKGRNDLEDKRREQIVLTKVARSPAVLSKTSAPSRRLTGEDNVKDDCSGECTQNLSNGVSNKITDCHPAGDEYSEAYRRIDMATGNRSDPISHCDDGQSEREGNSEYVDGCRPGPHPCDDRRAASEENKRKCSD